MQARQAEAVKLQQAVIRGEGAEYDTLPVGTLSEVRPHRPRRQQSRKGQGYTHDSPRPTTFCGRCGSQTGHDRQHCPAKDAECHKCGKRGHYMKVCKSRYRIQAVMDDEPETTFLGQVGNATNPWQVTVTVNGVAVPFCIDTGAEVTVIPACVFRKLSRTRLKPPVKILKGPSQNPLPVKGQFTGRLVLGHQTSQQDIYVVNNLHQPLLGRSCSHRSTWSAYTH